uniref:Bis(5'-adenosyl)-triphosphatase n=1 Tax=Kalanchoe fedtschenkoi TaxID=63787 RepID=A0A7N0TI67_KALFE
MSGTLASIQFKFFGFLSRSRLVIPSHTPAHRQPRIAAPIPASLYSTMASELYAFGPYKISQNEVFYSTQLSYAMVNLRPVVPVLLTPSDSVGSYSRCTQLVLTCLVERDVKRFVDLTAEETTDLWLAAQKIGAQLEKYHNASSLTFTIQDGPQAGQTVPHVHIHILPRKANDFEKNDEVYDAIDSKENELKQKLDLDKERIDRSCEEMADEADSYRKLF